MLILGPKTPYLPSFGHHRNFPDNSNSPGVSRYSLVCETGKTFFLKKRQVKKKY